MNLDWLINQTDTPSPRDLPASPVLGSQLCIVTLELCPYCLYNKYFTKLAISLIPRRFYEHMYSCFPRKKKHIGIYPPHKAQGALLKRRQKACKSLRWQMTLRRHLPDTAGLMHVGTQRGHDSMHRTCTVSKQTKAQHREGEVGSKYPL